MKMFCGLPVIVALRADVGRGRQRDQMRDRIESQPPGQMDHERRHRQTNDVVDEKGGKNAR